MDCIYMVPYEKLTKKRLLCTCHSPGPTLGQVVQASNRLNPSIRTLSNSFDHRNKEVISLRSQIETGLPKLILPPSQDFKIHWHV
uniref:Uncharacterized protein n=1 Tax=Vitis vinifera TaxID=29760 RepID=F6HFW1_VITVI